MLGDIPQGRHWYTQLYCDTSGNRLNNLSAGNWDSCVPTHLIAVDENTRTKHNWTGLYKNIWLKQGLILKKFGITRDFWDSEMHSQAVFSYLSLNQPEPKFIKEKKKRSPEAKTKEKMH